MGHPKNQQRALGRFYMYATIQVWAQAIEKAGTLELEAVIEALRTNEFDTISAASASTRRATSRLRALRWYVWKGGDYAPVDPGKLAD